MDRRSLTIGLLLAGAGAAAMAREFPPYRAVSSEVRTYDPDDHDWIEGALPAEDLTPQVRFWLQRSIYVGDPNNSAQFKDPAFQGDVPSPAFARRDPMRPSATEALGHEADLADYYRRVIALRPGPRFGSDPNFWLRLSLESAQRQVEIPFPWWDRLSDAAEFLTWLKTGKPGTGFLDQDQGWRIRAYRTEDRLYFFDDDPEDGSREGPVTKVSVERTAFLARLERTERDARQVIAGLKARLGIDPWS